MEDPFAGQERLNSMTPSELLFRNPHMSRQPQTHRPDLTQEQLDQISRDYYLGLTSAQIESAQSQASATTESSASTVHELPAFWSERLNQTCHVSNLSTDITSQRIMKQGPDKSEKDVADELELAFAETSLLRSEVENAMKAWIAVSKDPTQDPSVVSAAKQKLQDQRELFQKAQDRESTLMGAM